MNSSDLKPYMISDAVSAYYAGHRQAGTDPDTTTAGIYARVEKILAIEWAGAGEDRLRRRRFEANIRSALNRMVTAGTLYVVSGTRNNLYLTPQQYERQLAADMEVSAARRRHYERVQAVKDILTGLGLSPEPGRHLGLSLDDWEQLAEMARNGKALIRD